MVFPGFLVLLSLLLFEICFLQTLEIAGVAAWVTAALVS